MFFEFNVSYKSQINYEYNYFSFYSRKIINAKTTDFKIKKT